MRPDPPPSRVRGGFRCYLLDAVWSGQVSKALVSRLVSTEMGVYRARAEGREVPEKEGFVPSTRAMPTAGVSS